MAESKFGCPTVIVRIFTLGITLPHSCLPLPVRQVELINFVCDIS
jgi:hypothetical protein